MNLSKPTVLVDGTVLTYGDVVNLVRNKDGIDPSEPLPLWRAAQHAVLEGVKRDVEETETDKWARYQLATKLQDAGEIELTLAEIELIKRTAAAAWHVEVMGAIWTALG